MPPHIVCNNTRPYAQEFRILYQVFAGLCLAIDTARDLAPDLPSNIKMSTSDPCVLQLLPCADISGMASAERTDLATSSECFLLCSLWEWKSRQVRIDSRINNAHIRMIAIHPSIQSCHPIRECLSTLSLRFQQRRTTRRLRRRHCC